LAPNSIKVLTAWSWPIFMAVIRGVVLSKDFKQKLLISQLGLDLCLSNYGYIPQKKENALVRHLFHLIVREAEHESIIELGLFKFYLREMLLNCLFVIAGNCLFKIADLIDSVCLLRNAEVALIGREMHVT
jgi:hypothetical protein